MAKRKKAVGRLKGYAKSLRTELTKVRRNMDRANRRK